VRLRLALLLLRMRGPLDVVLAGVDWPPEGDIVLLRAHRRYVTIWSIWWERVFTADGDTQLVPELHVTRIPWRRLDMLCVMHQRRRAQ